MGRYEGKSRGVGQTTPVAGKNTGVVGPGPNHAVNASRTRITATASTAKAWRFKCFRSRARPPFETIVSGKNHARTAVAVVCTGLWSVQLSFK